MIVQDVINHIEELCPTYYAEDFDNTGLLVGEKTARVTGILVTLDTLENVVEEAIQKKCNLIVSFHPILFSGLKKLTGATYVERVVMKALRHEIHIYAMHTALDNSFHGVNARICDVLGLVDRKILIPKQKTIKKLVTYVPHKQLESVRQALFDAGAGAIGNYDHCSFNLSGTGSFRPGEGANPTLGEKGTTHFEPETLLSMIFPAHLEKKILTQLFTHHPYEEVAYEITTLENTHKHIGMGMTGLLKSPMKEQDFLRHVKEKMKVSCIRHSALLGEPVSRVAVLGGSGAFAISAAKSAGVQFFITADIKYHQFYQAEKKLVIADIGHYETEQFTKNLLVEYLKEKIHNFAIVLSDSNTNPIKYF